MEDRTTQVEASTRQPAPAGNGRTALLGAMFLMVTSAIGPGFITQTTGFMVKLGVAFAVVVSVLVGITVQMNVWRVVGVSGLRANQRS